MPDWSKWVTFILGTLAVLATLLGLYNAWRWRRRRLRLAMSIQPYALAGVAMPDGRPRPTELVQLDITNMTNGPITLTGVRMQMRGDPVDRPVFNEGVGEGWIVRKPIAPGETVFVRCSHVNESTLAIIRRVIVHAGGGQPVTMGPRAIRAAQRQLARARVGKAVGSYIP